MQAHANPALCRLVAAQIAFDVLNPGPNILIRRLIREFRMGENAKRVEGAGGFAVVAKNPKTVGPASLHIGTPAPVLPNLVRVTGHGIRMAGGFAVFNDFRIGFGEIDIDFRKVFSQPLFSAVEIGALLVVE